MSKAADIGRVSATGSFHILWGLVVSTVISSVATIFVARLLGSDLYGLYGVVLVAPTLIGVFRDWGVNAAMVRYSAQCRGESRENEVRSIFASGLIFEIGMGLALSALSFALSGFVATDVFHRPSIAPLIELSSISILAMGLVNAATAAFTGVEKMKNNSVMLIAQSIFKTAIMIALIVQGFGVAGAVTGYTAAYLVAGSIGVILMYAIYRQFPKPENNKLEIKSRIKSMLTYGTPVSISTIIAGFQSQFYAFLLPIFYISSNIAIGNYGIATTFGVLITFFATPITTMMLPAFSKLNPSRDKEALKNVFQFSIKYASLLVVPAAMAVMCLAQPAIATLFGSSFDSAPLFLALLTVPYAYAAFGTLTIGNFLLSQGETKFYLYLTLITAAIGFPEGYLLIMHFGVIGLLITAATASIPDLAIALYWVNKHYKLTLDIKSSAKILASSLTSAVLTYVLVTVLPFPSWVTLLIGIGYFILLFTAMVLLTRTLNKDDLNNLHGMTSGLGSIGKIVKGILDILEKLMIILKL